DPYDGIPACPSGTGGGSSGGTPPTTPPTTGGSTIGGTITRSEVMSRAANWYAKRYSIPYDDELDRTPLYADPDGAHYYGMDCSGFVSMAWHTTLDGKGGKTT